LEGETYWHIYIASRLEHNNLPIKIQNVALA
jgi:hypothetical protein